jgi:hypothetical protein
MRVRQFTYEYLLQDVHDAGYYYIFFRSTAHTTSLFAFRELKNTEYENATLAQIDELQFHEPCGQNAIHVVKVSQSH